ncbi:hypothetical protein GQ55_1G258100 [Panicum hallii var. hallii]|uniref:Uncharacterized protein n=2 Tax=Panicum hallii TaxID=206008 RepID=A0A2T7F7H7_9POAL|nr:hypothetical protein GQ55_1G258100 [Panicum hallii var. hallii]PVH66491.1 hypothetical protein PAHAL_1G262200 [Panicum hallii]
MAPTGKGRERRRPGPAVPSPQAFDGRRLACGRGTLPAAGSEPHASAALPSDARPLLVCWLPASGGSEL